MPSALPSAPRYDPRADTLDSLDARLVALSRSAAPLRRAFARLAGAFAARAAWQTLGFARLADYARERLGLSARELHDLAHVDAALAKLPAIDAALTSGRLGWTKARLLCRVARAEDEAGWLALAERLSAAALAREVRACDVGAVANATAADDEPGEREVLRVQAPRRVLAKWGDVKRTLRCVAGEWLPAETCAELVAAEVLSAVRLDEAADAPAAAQCVRRRLEVCDPEPAAAAPSTPAAPIPESPFVAALTEGIDAADPRELDARLRRAAALEQGLLARLGPLLLAFVSAGGPAAFGFRSLDSYARERLALSPRKARALLRVERACVRAPALAAAWRAGRVSWSQAQALVPLVLATGAEPHHEAWLARAASVTVRRLEDDVDHALASGDFDPSHLPALHTGVQISARPTLAEPNEAWVANVPADVGRLFRACLHTVQRRLNTCLGAALEAMFEHCLATWRARPGRPPAEHRVFERDGWRCTVPGCTSQRSLHAHHVVFRSAGGSDAAANLTTLCAFHHQRGVHAGVIHVSGSAPGGLVFELPLGRFGAGDVVLATR